MGRQPTNNNHYVRVLSVSCQQQRTLNTRVSVNSERHCLRLTWYNLGAVTLCRPPRDSKHCLVKLGWRSTAWLGRCFGTGESCLPPGVSYLQTVCDRTRPQLPPRDPFKRRLAEHWGMSDLHSQTAAGSLVGGSIPGPECLGCLPLNPKLRLCPGL